MTTGGGEYLILGPGRGLPGRGSPTGASQTGYRQSLPSRCLPGLASQAAVPSVAGASRPCPPRQGFSEAGKVAGASGKAPSKAGPPRQQAASQAGAPPGASRQGPPRQGPPTHKSCRQGPPRQGLPGRGGCDVLPEGLGYLILGRPDGFLASDLPGPPRSPQLPAGL